LRYEVWFCSGRAPPSHWERGNSARFIVLGINCASTLIISLSRKRNVLPVGMGLMGDCGTL
jgi:hypothetical protein